MPKLKTTDFLLDLPEEPITLPVVAAPYDRLYPTPGLSLPPWSPADGDVEGHYRGKVLGSRAIWVGNYLSQFGWLAPGDFLPLEKMTRGQAMAELSDLVGVEWGEPLKAARVLLGLQDGVNEVHHLRVAKAFLEIARPRYPESWAWWAPPVRMGNTVLRPAYRAGWRPTGFLGRTV